ncbi:MAG: c-type cytochrome [Alphaproteobacteria bacterium]|nr:c-type cytochrome [Alphaproteobacteria bacterium]
MVVDDPAFWRAGAISTIAVMSVVLIMLTIDSLAAISPGGSHVPPYTVINQHIDYKFDSNRGFDVPVISGAEPLFGKSLDEATAAALIDRGKMVIQSRACIDCHTFFGNGAYYAPDLTKAWLDPDWEGWQAVTGTDTREAAMVKFLMDPEQYRTWTRAMPNLGVSEEEAQSLVAYLKWMAAVDTNGFPPNFNQIEKRQ